jgi:hypothetical protein
VARLFSDEGEDEEAEVARGEEPAGAAASAPEGAFGVSKLTCKGAASPEMTFLTGPVASVEFPEVFFDLFD